MSTTHPPSAWDSHPDHSAEGWQSEVAANATRLGYHDWLAARLAEDLADFANHLALASYGAMADREDETPRMGENR